MKRPRHLLVQTSFLGDAVLSTPVVAALKQRYPDHELWLLTTPGAAQLLKGDPLIDSIIIYDKRGLHSGVKGFFALVEQIRAQNFERAFALQRSARTAMLLFAAGVRERVGFKNAALSFLYQQRVKRPLRFHDVKRNLALVVDHEMLTTLNQGELDYDQRYPLRLFAPELEELSLDLRAKLQEPYIVLVPASVWPTKRWDKQHFRTLAARLSSSGLNVVVLGARDESEICRFVCAGSNAINLSAMTTLSDLSSIIKHSSLVVCNDSLALHIAAAFQRPTVALFCATSPAFGFGPWSSNAVVLERSGLECKPCRRHGSKECPTQTRACMLELSPDLVEFWINEILTNSNRQSRAN